MTFQRFYDIIRENVKELELVKKEKYELTASSLDYLLDKLFLAQHQVIVRSDNVVVGMFGYEDLRRFLKTKGYHFIYFLEVSYGYELEVPVLLGY